MGEPHDQGLVFKWGSLVGIEMLTVAGNGTLFRGAADVVFRPAGFTGTITDDWTTVPFCNDDFAPYGDKTADHLNQVHTPANFAKGWGDICRYMGAVDGARWRMPTAAEIAELYGSDQIDGGQSVVLGGGWTDGNYYPLSGRAMGPHQTNVAITGNDTDARVTNADPNTNGAVFVPACGLRDRNTGAIYNIGSRGYCWSSTASTMDRGYDMQFYSSIVYPQWSDLRTFAFGVRCIRE